MITITNKSPEVAVIDIEGVIGIPEHWQFEDPGMRVATYEKFRKTLEALAGIEQPRIVVNIRSTGGNVNDALMIFDALKALGAGITTRCYGYVASAATIIAQAASEGCREISANSLYLIHRAVCSAEGNSEELTRSLEMLAKTDDRIAEVYSDRSGESALRFRKLMAENNGNGRWLSPEEVLQNGLADRIIGRAETDKSKNAGAKSGKGNGAPASKNKQNTAMNISKYWNALMKVMGLAEEAERHGTVENQAADGVETDVEERMPETGYADLARMSKQIATLQGQISVLEAENARLAAAKTQTKPKEDPSPSEGKYRSANEVAYENDLRNIL